MKGIEFGKPYGAMRVRPLTQHGRFVSHIVFEIEEATEGMTTISLEATEAARLYGWLAKALSIPEHS